MIAKGRALKFFKMIKNIGTIDRIVRGILALVLIYLAYTLFASSLVWSVILFAFGIFLILEVIFGICLLYKILGIDTAKHNLPMNLPSQSQPPQQPQA